MSQSLFSWIHLSYAFQIRKLILSRKCLNPYFPGFIFLIGERRSYYDQCNKRSQSLFSWIHLSYPNHPHDLPNSSFPSQSLFSWIHLSYRRIRPHYRMQGVRSQSLFSWIHLSYCIRKTKLRFQISLSQSLFSWIHLSYHYVGEEGTPDYFVCLNPYFPGFIFLIKKWEK